MEVRQDEDADASCCMTEWHSLACEAGFTGSQENVQNFPGRSSFLSGTDRRGERAAGEVYEKGKGGQP